MDNESLWDGSYHVISPLGIYIQHESWKSDDEMVAIVDSAWISTRICTGITIDIDRAFVINYIDDVPELVGHIEINNHVAYIDVETIDLVGNYQPITRHEMIHYLLYMRDKNTNPDHSSALFNDCS